MRQNVVTRVSNVWDLRNCVSPKAVRQLLLSEAEGMEVGVGSGRFAVPLGIKDGVLCRRNFPHGRSGFVLMVTTICFVDDIVKSFREALRVLKPDGLSS